MMLKESYCSRLIDYDGDSFTQAIKSKGISTRGGTTDTERIFSAYKYSLSQCVNSRTLSRIYTIAMNGDDTDINLNVRREAISLSKSFSNLRVYNPTAPDRILPTIADITAFLSNDMTTDVMVKAALAHYQFEMIHPYERYNGIVGRIMIPMIMYNHGIKAAPFLGLSELLYLCKNEYFDILRATQYSGGYISLIKFFVEVIYNAASLRSIQLEKMAQIIADDEARLKASNTSTSTLSVFEYFKKHLVSEIKPIAESLDVSYNTSAKAVDRLLEMSILIKDGRQSRHRKFVYDRLITALSSNDHL